MADQLPLPLPPRTPTPISDAEDDLPTAGLGIEGAYASSPIDTQYAFDPPSSPPSEATVGSAHTSMLSPTFSITAASPHDLYSPLTPQSATSDSHFQKIEAATTTTAANPFNFTPQQYTVGRPNATLANRVVRRQPPIQRTSIHQGANYDPGTGQAPRSHLPAE